MHVVAVTSLHSPRPRDLRCTGGYSTRVQVTCTPVRVLQATLAKRVRPCACFRILPLPLYRRQPQASIHAAPSTGPDPSHGTTLTQAPLMEQAGPGHGTTRLPHPGNTSSPDTPETTPSLTAPPSQPSSSQRLRLRPPTIARWAAGEWWLPDRRAGAHPHTLAHPPLPQTNSKRILVFPGF